MQLLRRKGPIVIWQGGSRVLLPRVVFNMRVMKRRRDFAAEPVSYRNYSDVSGKRGLFDSLPDEIVISILCKLPSATCPSDFANVLLTCKSLNASGLDSFLSIRQRNVNKILETKKRQLTVSGQVRLHVLRKIAIRFEEKIYTSATSQSDYLQKISLKMLTMELKSQNLPSNSAGNSNKSPDAAPLDSTAQTGHANGADWQEEVYQKIEIMKDLYLPDISEMYQKVVAKLQQHDSLPQQSNSDQLEKLKVFKNMLERIITFLQVSKNEISPGYKENLGSYDKQILNFIIRNWPKKPALQQGQLPAPHMQTMQQPPQLAQIQSHENQMNPQLQSMNLQGSVPTMLQNSMSSLQHNSMSLSGASTAQPNMMNSLEPGSNLDSGQGNSDSLRPVTMGSLQQNPVSTPQQTNINTLSSQSGVNVLQPNINPLQSNSNMLQQQHLKQQQEQQMQQQIKQQIQQRQMQQQFQK